MIQGVTQPAGIEPAVTARAAASPRPPANGGGFAAELDRESRKSTKKSPAAKPAQVPERTNPVAGHGYAEITAGPRNGMFLNTSGNERNGQAFLIVEREGRTFHVYGTGENRAVFEVKHQPAPAAAPTAPAATTTPAAPSITPGVTTTPQNAGAATPGLTTPAVTLPRQ